MRIMRTTRIMRIMRTTRKNSSTCGKVLDVSSCVENVDLKCNVLPLQPVFDYGTTGVVNHQDHAPNICLRAFVHCYDSFDRTRHSASILKSGILNHQRIDSTTT